MKKLAVILLAMIMALSMAVFAACANKPTEEPNKPDTPGTEQPATPETPVDEKAALKEKLDEFRSYLKAEHDGFSVSTEITMHDPDDGDGAMAMTVDATKTKVRMSYTMSYGETTQSAAVFYVYDETNELWYAVSVEDGEASTPDILFDNVDSVDYVIDNVIDSYASMEGILTAMDEATITDGAFTLTTEEGFVVKISFGEDSYIFEMSASMDGASLAMKMTFKTTAASIDLPAEVETKIAGVTAEQIAVARYINKFESSSALVTVTTSGTGIVAETKSGFIGGGEYSLYSDNNQSSLVNINGELVKITCSGENIPDAELYPDHSSTKTVRGMLYNEQIFTFYSASDDKENPYYCLKEGSDGKVVTLTERGKDSYLSNGVTSVEIDYSTEGTIVMTIKEIIGEDGEWNTVVTLTNVGEAVTPDYAPSVEYVKARVIDGVYYKTMSSDGKNTAEASAVLGYIDIVDIKAAIAVGDESYDVNEISPRFVYNNGAVSAVVVPSSITEANSFASYSSIYKIYYKGAEQPELKFANHVLLVYLYSESEPTGEGYFWHYDANNNITEYKNSMLFTITFHVDENEEYEFEITRDGFMLGMLRAPDGRDGKSFVGWYYDRDTWEHVFDLDKIDTVTENIDVYARFEKSYRVTFVTDHGNISDTDCAVINHEPGIMVSDDVYEFDGWYFDEEFTKRVEFPLVVTKDITLYAKWTEKVYGYRYVHDDNDYIVGCILANYAGDSEDVVIPREHNGYAVIGVDDDCFEGKEDTIYTLDIQARLGNITTAAFKNLRNLVKVTIGYGNTDIGGEIASYDKDSKTFTKSDIFSGCHTIRELRILSPELETAIETKVGYTFGGLRRYSIPDEMDVYYSEDAESKIKKEGCYFIRTDSMNRRWVIKYLPQYAETPYDVTLPDGLYGVDAYAFYKCREHYKIKTVNLNDVNNIKNNAFFNFSSLTELTVPDTVTSIGGNAFGSCMNLLTVTFGTGMKNLADGAFDGCTNLVEVINRSTKMTVSNTNAMFADVLVIKNDASATSSLVYHENGCVTLTVPGDDEEAARVYLVTYVDKNGETHESLTVPEGVTHIRANAFQNKRGIKRITLPSTLLYIGEYAFANSDVASVNLPDGLFEIGGYAFKDSAITSINIPASVAAVGEQAFLTATLKIVTVNGIIANIRNLTFGLAFDGCNEKGGCYYLGNAENPYIILIGAIDKTAKKCTISSSTKQIADYAFYNCKLTSISIPDSVTYIGASAFRECGSMYTVELGSSVTYIGNYAFLNCVRLYDIVNHSSLDVASYSAAYGNIADHALSIGTSSAITRTADGFVFLTVTDGSKAINLLITYEGEGGKVTLPESFNGSKYRVYVAAFSRRADITQITIPSAAIEPTRITLSTGRTINGIGRVAFAVAERDVIELKINFIGTREQWEAIAKDDLWYNELTRVTVTYVAE